MNGMASRRPTATRASKLPPLGSQVRICTGGSTHVAATVIEHRGPLGVEGREIVRVRYQFADSADVVETEVPLDELTPIVGAA